MSVCTSIHNRMHACMCASAAVFVSIRGHLGAVVRCSSWHGGVFAGEMMCSLDYSQLQDELSDQLHGPSPGKRPVSHAVAACPALRERGPQKRSLRFLKFFISICNCFLAHTIEHCFVSHPRIPRLTRQQVHIFRATPRKEDLPYFCFDLVRLLRCNFNHICFVLAMSVCATARRIRWFVCGCRLR